jgi:hypothetical protein
VKTRADVEAGYRERLEQRRFTLAALERVHARYAFLRVAIVLAAVAFILIAGWTALGWLIVPVLAFAVVAIAHARLLNRRDRAASAVAFYERGLARVTHQWIGHGREGRGLAPASHLYADDLDIFGRGSLFELLATARTHAGEETIARWLLAPADPRQSAGGTVGVVEEVRARQDAVRELAGRLDLRERVAVMGDALGVGVRAQTLRRWAAAPIALGGTAARAGVALVTTATVTTLVLWLTYPRWAPVLAVLIALQLLMAQSLKLRVLAVIDAVDESAHDLELLTELLRTIETEPLSSSRLRTLQAAVTSHGRPASVEIARLSRLIGWLSARHNVYFAMPAGLVMWATQWAFAIETWRARTGARIPIWLDAAGEFEALLALAAFAAEHPDVTVFPEIVEGPAHVLEGENITHPTLPPEAVGNTVALGDPAARLLIVSGSNMSGKSTLLRAVGVNAVLALAGAPVRARRFRISPLAVGAAIRVQDSLIDGRSRFMAEITRLKQIVDLAAARDGRVLFLLDEILGGTNSHDRRIGSEALLKGLVKAGALGLVTTHDLALGEIAASLPGRALNVHFEDRFEDGELSFDYRLRPGVVQTSNAIALMRSVGLDV